jgi:regulatory protein
MAPAGRDGAGARAGKKPSLKARALAMLAQRDHSAAELRRKLLRHASADADTGASAAESDAADAVDRTAAAAQVDAVIDWLREHRYLSEERFIESRVHTRAARFGNLRIRQELAQHGLALPPQAAQALKDSELERATEVWRRKFGMPPSARGMRGSSRNGASRPRW